MKTDLQACMASGVFVEFRDSAGNTVGRAVFAGWADRPLPGVGERFAAPARDHLSAAPRKRSGVVQSRQFDVQTDLEGEASVWVHLVVEVRSAKKKKAAAPRFDFSDN